MPKPRHFLGGARVTIASAGRTIRPGELNAAQLEADGAASMRPVPPPPEWLVVAEHVVDRLPALAAKLGRTWSTPGGHFALLWLAIVALAVGLVVHVIGDGTVRDEARSTRVLVLWLVRRAQAEDNGAAPPPFPYDEL